MSRARLTIAVGRFAATVASRAYAQSAGDDEAEVALLKQQLRLVEQKLDKLQKQSTANARAAAVASAKAAKANTAIPVKRPIASSDLVVKVAE